MPLWACPRNHQYLHILWIQHTRTSTQGTADHSRNGTDEHHSENGQGPAFERSRQLLGCFNPAEPGPGLWSFYDSRNVDFDPPESSKSTDVKYRIHHFNSKVNYHIY